jgi:hypothetical protein
MYIFMYILFILICTLMFLNNALMVLIVRIACMEALCTIAEHNTVDHKGKLPLIAPVGNTRRNGKVNGDIFINSLSEDIFLKLMAVAGIGNWISSLRYIYR